MNKQPFPKHTLHKSILHPGLVSFYTQAEAIENIKPAAQPRFSESSYITYHPKKHQYIKPHTWEFSDYDDDHFESL